MTAHPAKGGRFSGEAQPNGSRSRLTDASHRIGVLLAVEVVQTFTRGTSPSNPGLSGSGAPLQTTRPASKPCAGSRLVVVRVVYRFRLTQGSQKGETSH